MTNVFLDRFFELKISGHDADSQPTWNRTEFGSNAVYHVVYVDVLYYVLCFAVPLISLVFMNWRVIIGYRAARRRRSRIVTSMPMTSRTTGEDHPQSGGGHPARRSRPKTGEHESALTLVMIAIVIVFIACQSPARLVQLIWGYYYTDCRQVNTSAFLLNTLLPERDCEHCLPTSCCITYFTTVHCSIVVVVIIQVLATF